MDCKQCAENLTAYQDAELSAAESDEVSGHLKTCPSCTEELHSLRMTAGHFESRIREIEPSPETWRLVQARITAGQVSTSRLRGFSPRWRFATAVLVIIAVIGLGYVQYRQYEKKKLDTYITQYLQERNARIRHKSVLADSNTDFENPYAGNPFREVKATPSDNPFQSEDR